MGYTDQTIKRYQEYVNNGLANLMEFVGFHAVEKSSRGMIIADFEGNEYLDFLGGYGVFALGHSHPKVIAAVEKQLHMMPMSSKVLFNGVQAELAEKLAEIAPGNIKYSFICNSGTEAVEGALKLARLYTGKTEIIGTAGGFHGKTYGGLSASGRDIYKAPFKPLVPEFSHVPFGDIDAVKGAVTANTAAVIVEPIQGENGVIVPEDNYLIELRKLCTEANVLLILDEVQTGMGRTGKMFACEHYGVVPDIITLAKALGGGVMPIGAFMSTPEIWKAMEPNPLLHSSTFGGNELASAAAVAAISAIQEENLAQNAEIMGEYLLTGLRNIAEKNPECVVAVRGKGLLVGVEFTDKDIAALVIAGFAQQRIVAAYTLNNPKVIRFEPPLIVTKADIDRVLTSFESSIKSVMELIAD